MTTQMVFEYISNYPGTFITILSGLSLFFGYLTTLFESRKNPKKWSSIQGGFFMVIIIMITNSLLSNNGIYNNPIFSPHIPTNLIYYVFFFLLFLYFLPRQFRKLKNWKSMLGTILGPLLWIYLTYNTLKFGLLIRSSFEFNLTNWIITLLNLSFSAIIFGMILREFYFQPPDFVKIKTQTFGKPFTGTILNESSNFIHFKEKKTGDKYEFNVDDVRMIEPVDGTEDSEDE